jgi:transaldolase
MGMTSNPAIFEKAIAGGADYDEAITQAALMVASVNQIYEQVASRTSRMRRI